MNDKADQKEERKTALIDIRQEKVNERFWPKLLKYIGRIPFAEDLVASYFCTTDPTTPLSARASLLGALAYFILPTDLVPDFIAVLGFSDDATVLAIAMSVASAHIKPSHRKLAAEVLGKKLKEQQDRKKD